MAYVLASSVKDLPTIFFFGFVYFSYKNFESFVPPRVSCLLIGRF